VQPKTVMTCPLEEELKEKKSKIKQVSFPYGTPLSNNWQYCSERSVHKIVDREWRTNFDIPSTATGTDNGASSLGRNDQIMREALQ